MISDDTCVLLRQYAQKYETADFLCGDPSWFMHQVEGALNQETLAFLASCLSYGSRTQFIPKIAFLLEKADGEPYTWVRCGAFEKEFHKADGQCFYRLYTKGLMYDFLSALRRLLCDYGSLGAYIRSEANDGLGAVAAICRFFSGQGIKLVVPQDTQSACKRVCMFLRWMVRSGSPVDLGLWADFIDRRTLVMPLDTHVLSQACRIGLLKSRNATMSTAIKLTETLKEVFPDDPLRGDFALFGYGVNNK